MKVTQSKGFSIIEIIIGLAILSISFFVMSSAAESFLKVSFETSRTLRGAFLLEEGVEAVRSIRDQEWTEQIVPLVNGTWYNLSIATTPSTEWDTTLNDTVIDGIFFRRFKLSSVNRDANDDIAISGIDDPNTRKVTVEVSWLGGNGATTTKSVNSYITNYFND